MSNAIRNAWNFIFNRFYSPKAGLLFDFLTDDRKNADADLPTPAEIARDDPNPCGWGTGMEDCVLSGGTAIDALVAGYAATEDKTIPPLCGKLWEGMLHCADVARNEGFVARGFSPEDGKSHYSDSSRDQYTHFVYAAVRYFRSPMSKENQKADIRRVLSSIARKCERDVTAETGFQLLRDDGKPGIVSTMWGDTLGAHEYMRLPMFYLSAFFVTGENHFREKYLEYRDEALVKSHGYPYREKLCYSTLQMSYSLRLVYDLDPDPVFRAKTRRLLDEIADFGEERVLSSLSLFDNPDFRRALNFTYTPWREAKTEDMGVVGGKHYRNPGQNSRKINPAFYPLRGIGEAASIAALCPGRRVSDSVVSALEIAAGNIDYTHHHTYAPLLLASGYLLCLENRKQNPNP